MDKPKFNKYSIFTLLFFGTGVLYYTMQKQGQENSIASEKLGKISQGYYYRGLVDEKQVYLHGETMGGIRWNIKYIDEQKKSYQEQIDTLLVNFNKLFSTYDTASVISIFNQSNSINGLHPWFYDVLECAQQVHKETDGAFDPTVMPLVNAWGFGPNKFKYKPSETKIDSILNFVGYEKIFFDSINLTKPEGLSLDFSAIAKGYATDKIAEFLEAQGYNDYMVEIGGEVRCKGRNLIGNKWGIQIINPQQPSKGMGIIGVDNGALATSGNYINFKMIDGKKYSHSINPKTGSAKESNLLSASVYTRTCMEADAYATACMVMGFEDAKKLINSNERLEAYFVYYEGKKAQIWFSDGLKDLLIEE